jgi:uncharacterized protein YacL
MKYENVHKYRIYTAIYKTFNFIVWLLFAVMVYAVVEVMGSTNPAFVLPAILALVMLTVLLNTLSVLCINAIDTRNFNAELVNYERTRNANRAKQVSPEIPLPYEPVKDAPRDVGEIRFER